MSLWIWLGMSKPEPAPPNKAVQGVKILGHVFRPMDRNDWDAYAGAEPGSLICYCEDGTVLIANQRPGYPWTVEEMVDGNDFSLTDEGEVHRAWMMVKAIS